MISSLSLKTIRRSNKNIKARYSITNVSIKDISKIMKEFEKLTCEVYVRKSSNNEYTDS